MKLLLAAGTDVNSLMDGTLNPLLRGASSTHSMDIYRGLLLVASGGIGALGGKSFAPSTNKVPGIDKLLLGAGTDPNALGGLDGFALQGASK